MANHTIIYDYPWEVKYFFKALFEKDRPNQWTAGDDFSYRNWLPIEALKKDGLIEFKDFGDYFAFTLNDKGMAMQRVILLEIKLEEKREQRRSRYEFKQNSFEFKFLWVSINLLAACLMLYVASLL